MNTLLIKRTTGEIYKQVAGHEFINLKTKVKGVLDKKLVAKHLRLPVGLNAMVDKNPALLTMIEELELQVFIPKA